MTLENNHILSDKHYNESFEFQQKEKQNASDAEAINHVKSDTSLIPIKNDNSIRNDFTESPIPSNPKKRILNTDNLRRYRPLSSKPHVKKTSLSSSMALKDTSQHIKINDFCIKINHETDSVKRSVAKKIHNTCQMENNLKTRLELLGYSLGFSLNADLEPNYDILDKMEITQYKMNKVQQKIEQYKSMGMTKDQWFFIPSFESIKLKILTEYKIHARVKKRECVQSQLKFEELYNFLFFFRNKDINTETALLQDKCDSMTVKLEEVRIKRKERKKHLESINALTNSRNAQLELTRLDYKIKQEEESVKQFRSKLSFMNIQLDNKRRYLEGITAHCRGLESLIKEMEQELDEYKCKEIPLNMQQQYQEVLWRHDMKLQESISMRELVGSTQKESDSLKDDCEILKVKSEEKRRHYEKIEKDLTAKVHKLEKETSAWSDNILNCETKFQNTVEEYNKEIDYLVNELKFNRVNVEVDNQLFYNVMYNKFNVPMHLKLYNFADLENYYMAEIQRVSVDDHFTLERKNLLTSLSYLNNIPDRLFNLMTEYYNTYSRKSVTTIYKNIKAMKLNKNRLLKISNSLHMQLLLFKEPIDFINNMFDRTLEFTKPKFESLLKGKPFYLQTLDRKLRADIIEHVFKTRDYIDCTTLEKIMKNLTKYNKKINFDYYYKEPEIKKELSNYFNKNQYDLQYLIQNTTNMPELLLAIEEVESTNGKSLNRTAVKFLQLINFKINREVRKLDFEECWYQVKFDTLLEHIHKDYQEKNILN